MGWLDKLLGREESQTNEPAVEDAGRSEVGAAEERVAQEGDESAGAQGPIPPGTG